MPPDLTSGGSRTERGQSERGGRPERLRGRERSLPRKAEEAKGKAELPSPAEAAALFGDSVYRLALLRCQSRVDAEDVFQDVFLQLVTTKTRLTGAEHMKAWLLRATEHRCIDVARRDRRHKTDSLEELGLDMPEPEPDGAPPWAETTPERLLAAVWKLSPELRDVIHLHYYENYSCKEIAKMMDCTSITVRTRLHRARKKLGALLNGSPNE